MLLLTWILRRRRQRALCLWIEDAVAQTYALDSIISAHIHAVVEDSELRELSLQDGEERDAHVVLHKLYMHKAA
jgi:hypothetical protein